MKHNIDYFNLMKLAPTIKITFLSLSVFLGACTSVKLTKLFDREPKPNLVFEETKYNYGYAGRETEVTHIFKYSNTGNASLVITKVSKTCGCTDANLSAKEITPGGKGEIHAILKTKRYEGKQEESLTVHSNDPNKPEIKLTIAGIVKTEVVVDPSGINFGDVVKGKAVTERVRLLQLSRKNFILNKVDTNEKYIAVTTSRFREENSRGINIDITLKADIPVGILNEVITLHTNLKKHPRIDIPVWANILG